MTQAILPGGLTIGQPKYSIPRKSNRQEGNIQYIKELGVYTEFAGRENCTPRIQYRAGTQVSFSSVCQDLLGHYTEKLPV